MRGTDRTRAASKAFLPADSAVSASPAAATLRSHRLTALCNNGYLVSRQGTRMSVPAQLAAVQELAAGIIRGRVQCSYR